MKKILNNPADLVLELCQGLTYAHPQLTFDPNYTFIYKKEIDPQKVSVISGGGSGHEPAHAGFVGAGMLDGAVCGEVFASPSQVRVYKALQATQSDKGTLMIIKNYSGDIMNFTNAAHMAGEDGISVDYVKVEDDIAVQDSLYTVGRRGVAGTVLVHKVAGAAAARGMSLPEVKRVAQKTADRVRSIGLALSSCTVPAKGTPTIDLGEDDMEFGVGIHGEPGICREPLCASKEMAERMVAALMGDLKLQKGGEHEVILLVNGFGATPLQELYVLNQDVVHALAPYGVTLVRTLVGNYMTSIDMAGASVSILHLDDELKSLMNEPVDTPALAWAGPCQEVLCMPETLSNQKTESAPTQIQTPAGWSKVSNHVLSLENIIYLVDKMSQIIIREEVAFCELDSHAGDGDFGMSISRGFYQLKREWPQLLSTTQGQIDRFLDGCAIIIMEYCGGASGPIWGSAFRSAAKAVAGQEQVTIPEFAAMMQAMVTGIQTTGARSFGRGAQVGDKTLIDALVPCANVWSAASQDDDICAVFHRAAAAAVAGAERTREFAARMGRAGTVGQRSIGHPDAGAYALGVIFTELSDSLT